ncbi:hypothetical protein K2Z83_03245 [Oscillochloris sp. ZM17-4]|uniref:hypothetical protein n=1 Tax=Oscillochloris sp. ZM17-4 TaxID=2866714 RepID=UPI001C738116|nr:hypothetical protein [Oscillochloris sp. ZM17-4]MBX0326698.1 hypothetical protein [Oscillochloris sp. ZM17-4]
MRIANEPVAGALYDGRINLDVWRRADRTTALGRQQHILGACGSGEAIQRYMDQGFAIDTSGHASIKGTDTALTKMDGTIKDTRRRLVGNIEIA